MMLVHVVKNPLSWAPDSSKKTQQDTTRQIFGDVKYLKKNDTC